MTQSDCDAYVVKHFGGPLEPVTPQGRFSYTVRAAGGKTIVQFRESTSLPNLKYFNLISSTHPGLVAMPLFIDIIGGDSTGRLHVYRMDALPGLNLVQMANEVSESPQMQMTYVESLAKFFAQAWLNPVQEGEMLNRTEVATEIESRLEELRETLPIEFFPLVDHVLENIGRLTSERYRSVITHGDFSEFNILVNEENGAVSGVVDWPEACVLPFGFALHALEYALGGMYLTGWAFNDNASEVRKHFWTTFKQSAHPTEEDLETMKLARIIGILFRYGTAANGRHSSGMRGIGGTDVSLSILKALVGDEST